MSAARVVLRQARRADLDAIQRIIEAELYIDKPGFYWHTPEAIDRAIRAQAYFVVTENDVVVGATCLYPHGDSLWVDTVAVDSDHTRRGHGQLMIDFARRHAVEMGLRWLRVTSYREYDIDAAYLALGFRLVEKFDEYSEFEMALYDDEE